MLAVQGPRSRAVLSALMPEAETLGYFDHVPVKVADTAVTLSRTGYTGDLGFELTVPEDRAVDVLDAVLEAGPRPRHPAVRRGGADDAAHRGRARADRHRVARRPAGHERRRHGDAQGARLRLDAARRARRVAAVRRLRGDPARAAGRHVALGDHRHRRRLGGLGPALPRRRPVPAQVSRTRCPTSRCCITVGDDDRNEVGYCTSFVYSPVLQRHIGIARVRPDLGGGRHRAAARARRQPPQHHGPGHHDLDAVLRPWRGRRHDLPRVRRDRRRRRPQRAHPRGVPREGGAAHPGAGEERRRRRRGDHRGAGAGLPVHDVLLRAEPAAAGDHPRARPGQARLPAADDAVVVPPDRRRRLPALRRRPPGRTSRRSAGTRRATPTPTSATTTTSTGSARRCGRCSTTRRPTSSARSPRTPST